MNLIDAVVKEVLDMERFYPDMEGWDFLDEPVNIYRVRFIDEGGEGENSISVSLSNDKGQIKPGYEYLY